MIETNDYWIIEDQFIFKPHFDSSIDVYKNIISKYNKLVFSNYNDVDICIKRNNKYDSIYSNNFIGSKFNQIIDLPPNLTHITFGRNFNQLIDLPPNLVYINFGDNFNQKVVLPLNLVYINFGYGFNQKVDLPQNLTHLTFGFYFNQKVDLPQNLVHINFGKKFNQKVNLPPNLVHINFGYYFNQKVDLPLDIKYLKINCDNRNIIDYLPDSIEELVLDLNFNLELNDLPQSIKKICFNSSNYNKELNCLPSNIEYIQLPKNYDKEIVKYPNKLKTIKCLDKYKYIELLKEKGYEVLTY
jgi:hypothetical protein